MNYRALWKLSIALILLLATGAAARAANVTSTWNTGSAGPWATAGNWSPAGIPNNGVNRYTVIVDDTAANVDVSVNGTYTIDHLRVDAGDQVTIDNNRSLSVTATGGDGVIQNAGTILMNSSGGNTYIRPDGGAITLSGGGQLVMSNSLTNFIYGSTLGSLVNVDNTIRGAGFLGHSVVTTNISNGGLVVADAVLALIVDPGVFTNTGTLRATGGSTLQLNQGTYANAGGTIEAQTGSVVTLQTGVSIAGGTLQSAGTGVIRAIGSNVSMDDLTNAGALDVANNGAIYLSPGTIQNTGTITMSSTGGNTYLRPEDGVVTLAGGGQVLMSNSLTNFIYGASNGSLVNENNTIHGAGFLGHSAVTTDITNQGLVVADAALPLIVDPGVLTNTGTLRATGGSTLQLNHGAYANAGGVIEALNGSFVSVQSGASISGGTLQTAGTGVIRVTGLVTASSLTTTGALDVANNAQLLLTPGTLQNTGTISLSSSGGNTYLRPDGGTVTFAGGGQIVMSNSTTNFFYSNGGGTVANLDNTIRGAGYIGHSAVPTTVTNAGTIIADQTLPLRIDADDAAGFTNTGTVSVTGAGGLQILSGPMNQKGSVTVAAGRTLSRTGNYTQTAGTTTIDGAIAMTGGFVELNGGTLKGTGQITGNVTNAGIVAPGASPGTLTVSGAYSQTMAGVLRVEIDGLTPGTQHDVLAVTGACALEGEIHLVFSGAYAPAVGDQATILTAGTLTGDWARITVVNPPAGFFAYDVRRVGNTMVFKVLDPTGVPTPGVDEPDVADASAPVFRPLVVAPNPAVGGRATLSFQLPWVGARADVAVYDVAGRLVRSLLEGEAGTAFRAIEWDGRDEAGRDVAAGTYFARLTTDAGYGEVKRMTVVR